MRSQNQRTSERAIHGNVKVLGSILSRATRHDWQLGGNGLTLLAFNGLQINRLGACFEHGSFHVVHTLAGGVLLSIPPPSFRRCSYWHCRRATLALEVTSTNAPGAKVRVTATSIVSETIGQCEAIPRSDGSIQECAVVRHIQRRRCYNILGAPRAATQAVLKIWHSGIWCVSRAGGRSPLSNACMESHAIWKAMSYGQLCQMESYVVWIAMSYGKPCHMESHRNI